MDLTIFHQAYFDFFSPLFELENQERAEKYHEFLRMKEIPNVLDIIQFAEYESLFQRLNYPYFFIFKFRFW